MRIFSFSVQPKDSESISAVLKLKRYCDKTGMSFSRMVIDALKSTYKEIIDGKI